MTITISPSPSPAPTTTHHHHHHHHLSPQPSLIVTTTSSQPPPPPPPAKLSVDFSPTLIAMVVIVAAAFLVVTYSRLISRHLLPPLVAVIDRFRRRRHRRRRPPSSVGDIDSSPFGSSAFHALSPYGLDDSAIKTIPISIFTGVENFSDKFSEKLVKDSTCCAVCLLEFEDNDYVRTLPVCSHAFHVDCIDVWLRSQANCPLCRAGIFLTESPFIPLMIRPSFDDSRIRPSFDDSLLLMNNFITLNTDNSNSITSPIRSFSTVTEITPCIDESPPRRSNLNGSDERGFENFNGGGMILKRSYSFGFERSLAADRMLVMEPVTTSPWRYRRNGGGGGNFWSKRLSPFATSLTKSRVFSFRHYRGGGGGVSNKYSPAFFNRRRGGGGGLGFFPLSERFSVTGGGGGSSRRSKSMTSPMFMRSSASTFSSSRLRCGDPEALLSPERFNHR